MNWLQLAAEYRRSPYLHVMHESHGSMFLVFFNKCPSWFMSQGVCIQGVSVQVVSVRGYMSGEGGGLSFHHVVVSLDTRGVLTTLTDQVTTSLA